MMQKTLMITLLSLLVLQIVTSQECTDNEERFSFTNKKGVEKRKKCVWVANKSTFKRCKKDEIAENCPNTCSPDCLRPPNSATGCRDFPSPFQLLANNKFKNCAWVAKNAAKRCPKYPANVYCPLVCSTCGAEPSVSPTLSLQPTKSPSRAPSSTPSLSNNPSGDPSKSPSGIPTFICAADSADQFYVQGVGAYKPCDPWVKNNVADRCVMPTGIGDVTTGVVSDYCPETCGGCPDAPSANPTLSMKPSRVPSDEPSQSPSMASEAPSDSPSLLPSDDPSRSPSDTPSDQPSLLPSDEPSILPSDMPSDEPSLQPSECANSPWTVEYLLPSGQTTTYNCDNIGSFCESDGVGTELYRDKTASQACCTCGGSLQHTVSPSSLPTDEPSSKPSSCANYPESNPTSWTVDHLGTTYTCASFSPNSNCDVIYTEGTGGKTASLACCDCGGGNHVATAP